MKKITRLLFLIGIPYILLSQQQKKFDYNILDTIATTYFKAFSDKDATKMISFYANDIVYHDYTFEANYDKPLKLNGKEAIYNLYDGQFSENIKNIKFYETNRFFSGNVGVFIGRIHMDYSGLVFGLEQGTTVSWSTDYVITLFFKGSLIVKEIDFIDYPNAKIQ